MDARPFKKKPTQRKTYAAPANQMRHLAHLRQFERDRQLRQMARLKGAPATRRPAGHRSAPRSRQSWRGPLCKSRRPAPNRTDLVDVVNVVHNGAAPSEACRRSELPTDRTLRLGGWTHRRTTLTGAQIICALTAGRPAGCKPNRGNRNGRYS